MARNRALDLAISQSVHQAAQLHEQLAPSQQPSIVRWERFLPQQQLRVLLVEDDDSTGHVVTALLRNCGYEVTFAPNGLFAWGILMNQTNRVDLVLTEVVMPGLSGIGLLSRIMNHEPLKHIPVIMMSSLDSMGVVFKCLSKGAVDFLVKPVRKNELKNLWQHIWRRCHSFSGSRSGSGSGSQTLKVEEPDTTGVANNSGSNNESDDMSSELNLEGGSDNGSGTQSSWTKKAVEVESSHPGISGGSRLHSSIQSKNGGLWGPVCQEGKDNSLSRNANLADSRVATAELLFFCNDQVNLNSTPEMTRIMTPNTKDISQLDEGVDSALLFVNQKMANGVNEIPIKVQECADEQQADSEDANVLPEKHASNSPSSKGKTLSDSSSPSLLKLSLKRPSQAENDIEDEVRGPLKRSRSSAFSRYNNSGNNTPSPAGAISAKVNLSANAFGDHSLGHGSSVGSSRPSVPLSSRIDRPSTCVATDEVMASPFFKGILHGSSNQNGGLAHTFLPGKQNLGSYPIIEEVTHLDAGPGTQTHFYPSPVMPNAHGSCKKPFSADTNLPPHWGLSTENVGVQEYHVPHRPIQDHQSTHANEDAEIHHHSHHHHHHHHHHVQHHYHHHQDQPQQQSQIPQLEDSTVINVGASAPICGSSNTDKCPEDNNGQSGSCNGYGSNGNGAVSLNGSATGSNGGQSAAVEPSGVGNVDSSTQIGAGSGLTVAHGLVLGLDESRHARREAALTKFRQKRKERCFEKKVRYQSRKRLAEQRPRVRGQFVRQSVK